MKIRPLPIFLSFLFSAILLFGGWYGYEEQFVKKPIRDEIGKLKGVSLKKLTPLKDSVAVDVSIQDPKEFKNNYNAIEKIVQEKSGGKAVSIHLDVPKSSLDILWDKNQFAVAEAIDLHQYSRIPQIFDDLVAKKIITQKECWIDDRLIYIYMTDGHSSFYKVLSRTKEVNQING